MAASGSSTWARVPLTPEGYRAVRDTALIRAMSIQKMVAAHPDKFELALTAADAARINASGKKIVYMSIENSYELGEDLSLLDTFYKLGVRMAGPVHNGTNQLADSTNPGELGMKWGGLSPLGKDYVRAPTNSASCWTAATPLTRPSNR
jgi:membrane dipeptidase